MSAGAFEFAAAASRCNSSIKSLFESSAAAL